MVSVAAVNKVRGLPYYAITGMKNRNCIFPPKDRKVLLKGESPLNITPAYDKYNEIILCLPRLLKLVAAIINMAKTLLQPLHKPPC